MHVTILFTDGEVMEGTSESATLSRMGFPVRFDASNNQVAWVSLASIKYVLFRETVHDTGDADPRGAQGMTKIVLHFNDGETLRSYKDDTFSQEGEGFMLRLWDTDQGGLIRVLVSLHALKAIFFVNQWDSRTDAEKFKYSPEPGAPEPLVPAPTLPVEGS
jgi:hypothetical protein